MKRAIDRQELDLKLSKLSTNIRFISEKGETNGWKWIKYNDNFVEMQRSWVTQSTSGSASVPSGFYLYQETITFPFTFRETPLILTDGYRGTGVTFTQVATATTTYYVHRRMCNVQSGISAIGFSYVSGFIN